MGINITHTMNNFQFENKENLRNAAKNILNRQGASEDATHRVIEQSVFNNSNTYINPQLSILQASSLITLNNPLKETLKYLSSQAKKKNSKEVVLGELWAIFSNNEESNYESELIDFEVDFSAQNIFEAA